MNSPIAPVVNEVLSWKRQHNVTYIVVKQMIEESFSLGDYEELLLRVIEIFKFDVDDMLLIQEVVTSFLEEQKA
jgi:hypothetical protein